MKSICAILLIVFSLNSFAEVTTVKAGQVAPYSGVLFSKDAELKLREMREEYQIEKKKTELLSKINDMSQKEIDILTQRVDNYRGQVLENRKSSDLEKAVYFLAGALITGFVSYGVIKANR
jgi:hypothetical protein